MLNHQTCPHCGQMMPPGMFYNQQPQPDMFQQNLQSQNMYLAAIAANQNAINALSMSAGAHNPVSDAALSARSAQWQPCTMI